MGMRRMVAWMVPVGVLGFVAPTLAGEVIYRWVDTGGGVHFSNVPSPGARETDLAVADEPGSPEGMPVGPPEGEGQIAERSHGDGDSAPGPAGQRDATEVSAQSSLRRQQLEREIKQSDQQLKDIDSQLQKMAQLRSRFAKGTAMTGGVATNADSARSPEEKQLAEQREQVAQQSAALRTQYGKLRDEVTAQLGGVPDWWIDVP